jgi:CDP-diacylglycerol--glycerol-3-phosphate 3-phosphatidyltransferase
MLNKFARALFGRIFAPVAHLLMRLGVSPDAVTIVGTLGVCVGALGFFPRGELFWGVMVITAFVFSDIVDGIMARELGRTSSWGAFLDSSLDRVGDAAVFGGLVMFYAGKGDNLLMAWLAMACLTLGSVVSYVKARAEGLGMQANVGIAERSDRLVATLLVTGFVGVNWVPYQFLMAELAILAVLSAVTIMQRVLLVRSQALAPAGQPAGQTAGQPAGQPREVVLPKDDAPATRGQDAPAGRLDG